MYLGHGLGMEVPKGLKAEEMIWAAGLDWKVELRPARGAQEINKKGEYSRYEVVRVPLQTRRSKKYLFGVVSGGISHFKIWKRLSSLTQSLVKVRRTLKQPEP